LLTPLLCVNPVEKLGFINQHLPAYSHKGSIQSIACNLAFAGVAALGQKNQIAKAALRECWMLFCELADGQQYGGRGEWSRVSGVNRLGGFGLHIVLSNVCPVPGGVAPYRVEEPYEIVFASSVSSDFSGDELVLLFFTDSAKP